MALPPPILLCIEDEQPIVELLATLAAPLGLQIAAASSGHEGLELLRHIHPALVTLDLVLPDIDGFAVLEQIRQRRELDDLPIIVITAINDTTAVRAAYALGASDFVSKPFNIDLLEAKLRVFSRMRQLSDEVRERERFLEEVVDNLSSGLVVCDRMGRVLRLNGAGAAQLGLDHPDDAIGRLLVEIAPGSSALLDPQQQPTHRQTTVRLPRGDRDLGFATSALDGGCVVAVFRELSAVEASRRDAEGLQRSQAMARGARSFAHEVRNPIAAISAAAQLIAHDGIDPAKRKRLASAIEGEAERIAVMVGEYIERQVPAPPTGSVDLKSLLEGVLDLNLLGAAARQRVTLEVTTTLPRIRGNEARLKQVVLNLLLNAIAATVEGDRIRLLAAAVGDRVMLTVSDTGHGINEFDLPRIFDEAFTTRMSGNGLGLPIVRRIIEEHGGEVHVDSAPGQGTTFTVNLPAE